MILAVDGGGTKTHVLITDDSGTVLAEGFGGPMLWTQANFEQALKSLESAISDASSKIQQQMPTFTSVVIGIAGIDTPSEVAQARHMYTQAIRNRVSGDITVVNDMMIALLAGSVNSNAVVINAGTGSSCYGYNQQGIQAKASGLDYLLSDEGSAFYIGQQILRSAVRSADGRGKKTVLEEMVKQHYSVTDISEIKSKIYSVTYAKSHIAKLSYLINQAAQSNDEVAQEILQSTIKELALAVKAVVVKLGIGREKFDLVLTGGLFTNEIIHPKTFGAIISNMFPLVQIVVPKLTPVYGAVRLAILRSKKNNELSL